jgi:hypothetical protein
MANFKGKNNLNSKDLFVERTRYSVDAFPTDDGTLYPRPIKDFNFGERVLYGRINKRHMPVVANKELLKDLQSKGDPNKRMQVLNFVADAFEAMVQDFNSASFRGKLVESDELLKELVAETAHIDYYRMYTSYIDALQTVFLDAASEDPRSLQIKNFDMFLPLYIDFAKRSAPTQPITRSKFVTSNYVNPMISGLAIEVLKPGPSTYGDDSYKERFINSPNFPIYQELALKHGFSIDKNIPWRLVANIQSKSMLVYAGRYGHTSDDSILRGCYFVTYADDLGLYAKTAMLFYNAFVDANPPQVVGGSRPGDSPTPRAQQLKKITMAELNSKYPVVFWVDSYVDVRYNEQNRPGSRGKIISLKKSAQNALKIGQVECLRVINDALGGFSAFAGSYSDLVNRKSGRERGKTIKSVYSY